MNQYCLSLINIYSNHCLHIINDFPLLTLLINLPDPLLTSLDDLRILLLNLLIKDSYALASLQQPPQGSIAVAVLLQDQAVTKVFPR